MITPCSGPADVNFFYSGIHTPCPCGFFWPDRHNFGDIDLTFFILS